MERVTLFRRTRPRYTLSAHISKSLFAGSGRFSQITSHMDSSPHVWFCACKSATLAHELLVSVGPSPHLWYLHAKQRLLYEHTSLYGFQTSTVASCIQNSVISTRITYFYGFQPSSVVLCIQNSDLRTKIACLWVPDLTCDFLHAKQRA